MDDILSRFNTAVKKHTLYPPNGGNFDEFFSISAFLGEAGEYANARKKQEFKRKIPSIGKKLKDRDYHENSIDEAGDTLFYFVQCLQKAGITVEEVLEHQIKKLNDKSLEMGKTFKK